MSLLVVTVVFLIIIIIIITFTFTVPFPLLSNGALHNNKNKINNNPLFKNFKTKLCIKFYNIC